jgi:hypothetical protein
MTPSAVSQGEMQFEENKPSCENVAVRLFNLQRLVAARWQT